MSATTTTTATAGNTLCHVFYGVQTTRSSGVRDQRCIRTMWTGGYQCRAHAVFKAVVGNELHWTQTLVDLFA